MNNHNQIVWLCHILMVLLLYNNESEGVKHARIGRHLEPAHEFSEHKVVQIRTVHSRSKREIFSSSEESGLGHAAALSISLVSPVGDSIVLELLLNRDLIPKDFFQKTQHQGQDVIERPNDVDLDLCHYKGVVHGEPHSWAAISTCRGIRGVFYDGNELFHIEKVPDTNKTIAVGDVSGAHYLYKHSDLRPKDHKCGFEDTPFYSDGEVLANKFARPKREISNSKDSGPVKQSLPIEGPWNANVRSRYVELVLVVDKQKFDEHDKDEQKVIRICKEVANIMNALYSPLNIYIALVGVIVWTEFDEITLSPNGDTTLTNFLHYRRERLVKTHPNDNAQLLTGVVFDGGVVGKALKGPICTYEFSGGVNMWHSDVVGLLATTVSHELGHNFGMEHDTEGCECPDHKCIMAPASSTMKPSFWSSCSLEHLALAFAHGMDYCLRNKPTSLFDGPVCGNGFVEPGEQCDCGLVDHCDNPCCDPKTCTQYANATCATGECCDFATCRPKPPGSTCRPADHECDLPEYCNGDTEFCPSDIFKVDGTTCKAGKAYCYQGACRTHTDQCKLLWGPSGKKSDNQCYDQNRKGTRHGNCGFNRLNNSYIQCNEEDVLCGMLHCSHLNERLEFGMESVAILSHSFINSGGRIIPCRTALVDLGLNDIDPGLAPEGSRCDDGKLCVDKKCMPIENLQIGPSACKDDCNGQGACNSLGHCHCNEGFAPPDCLHPGPGGSIDSGPAASTESAYLIAILSTIIPIIIILVLIAILIWCARRPQDWKLVAEQARVRSLLSFTSVTGTEKEKASGIEISAPMTPVDGSDSPSQELLSNAAMSVNEKSRTPSSDLGNGRSMLSSLGSWATGFSRSSQKSSNPEMTTSGATTPQRKTFVQSLAKSFSFPSPRLRLTSKMRGNTPVKYEVTVERRDPQGDDEIASPCEDTPLTPIKTESPVLGTAKIEEEKLETTVSLSPKGTTVLPSSSFSARPYRGTMTSSKPMVTAVLERKLSQTEKSPEEISLLNNKKLPQSSSFNTNRSKFTLPNVPLSSSSASFLTSKKPPPLPNKPLTLTNTTSVDSSPKTTTSSTLPTSTSASSTIAAILANRDFTNKISPPSSLKTATTTSPTATTTTTTTTATPTETTTSRTKSSTLPANISLSSASVAPIKVSSPTTTAAITTTSPTTTTPSIVTGTLSKTLTLPNSLSSAADKDLKLPKSSTLPTVQTRPQISRPILQTATSSAASLISKAPSTGVSQSSILAGNSKAERLTRDRSSRGVVFCDPITLPSPTNPNTPPIIHQPGPGIVSPTQPVTRGTVAAVISPTGSGTGQVNPAPSSSQNNEEERVSSPEPSDGSKAMSSLAKIKAKLKKGSKESGSLSPTSSIRSLEAPPRPERGRLRSLDISSPILQSSLNANINLVPVSRDPEVETTTPIVKGTPQVLPTSPKESTRVKARAPPPPVGTKPLSVIKEDIKVSGSPTPWRSSIAGTSVEPSESKGSNASSDTSSPTKGTRRPASMATTRSSRPTSRPPMPPPPRPGADTVDSSEHVYDTVADALAEKITSPLSKPPPPVPPPVPPTRPKSLLNEAAKKPVAVPDSPFTSPQEFVTPTSSPLFSRKSPDTVSTASSSEGDLMREILHEFGTSVSGDSIYNSLMRKDKRKKKKLALQAEEEKK